MTATTQRTKSSPQLKPILDSVAPLFYLSRVLGIFPFSFIDYINRHELRTSVIGTLWSLVLIVLNCGQYHIALTNSFNQNWGGDTNTLTAVIGIFIVYMEPVMMSVGILICIFYQKRIISCIDRVAKVDERMIAITSKAVSGEKVKRLAITLISASVICELGLVLFNFLQFQISDDIFLQTYWWICSGVPIFTDSISRLWYLVLIYLVKLRLEAINNYCQELQTTFKEKKDKYAMINAKNQQTTKTVSIGYLGQEIIDLKHRQQKKVQFVKPNKIHTISGFNPKVDCAKDPIPKIFLSETELTWNMEHEFTVDDKMDKKLIELVRIQDELCEIAKLINKICSFPILLTMAYGFMSVTAQLYFLYCGLVGQIIPILFRSADSISISILYIWYTSAKCVSIIYISWKTKIESQKTGIYLHKMANVIDENHFYHIVNHLSLKLLNNQLILTACGFFELDMTTIYAITGAITSYLIILIQFNLAAHKTRSLKGVPGNSTTTNATLNETFT